MAIKKGELKAIVTTCSLWKASIWTVFYWEWGIGNWVTLDAGIHFPRRRGRRRELVSTLHVRSSVVGGKEDSSIVSLVLLVSLASLVPLVRLASLSSKAATTPHDFGSAH
jgi:hypothetical protein